MQSPDMLINALVDEDCKMREIVQSFPLELRTGSPGDGRLGLKDTLAHLSCWDEFTVEYFNALFGENESEPPSFLDFQAAASDLQDSLSDTPFNDILEKYLQTTRKLLGMLRAYWEFMTPEQHKNLSLPLRHRRHHRQLLMDMLGSMSLDADKKMAGA